MLRADMGCGVCAGVAAVCRHRRPGRPGVEHRLGGAPRVFCDDDHVTAAPRCATLRRAAPCCARAVRVRTLWPPRRSTRPPSASSLYVVYGVLDARVAAHRTRAGIPASLGTPGRAVQSLHTPSVCVCVLARMCVGACLQARGGGGCRAAPSGAQCMLQVRSDLTCGMGGAWGWSRVG